MRFGFAGADVDERSGWEGDLLLVGAGRAAAGIGLSGLVGWLIAVECLLGITDHSCETVDGGLVGASCAGWAEHVVFWASPGMIVGNLIGRACLGLVVMGRGGLIRRLL